MTDLDRPDPAAERLTDLHPASALPPDQLQEYLRPPEHPEDRQRVHLTTAGVLRYEPMTPTEIMFAIEEIAAALERFAAVYPSLVQNEYDAERAYIKAKAQARLDAPPGGYDADRRAWAEVQSLPAMEAWQAAKVTRKAAEELAGALKQKQFGLMNVNRVTAALFNAGGHTR